MEFNVFLRMDYNVLLKMEGLTFDNGNVHRIQSLL